MMTRRTLLSMLAAAPLRSQAAAAELTVIPTESRGTIQPRVYGHFTEHIGRQIYEGIWVGTDSRIPNRNGYRLDTIEALKRVRPSVIRWPGGCFADAYHWRDGIGPPGERQVRQNLWWPQDDSNAFGTDEFLPWCEMVQAAPYLSVNVGSGSVGEALDWLDYCNGTSNSKWARTRVRNGREKPYGVRLWGIGNENWGCGGLFTAAEYAQRFREYAVYFKRMGMSSATELVGVGHTAGDWNRKFLDATGPGLPYLDHLSIHRYFHRGHSTQFTDADYLNLMLDLTAFEQLIRDGIQALDEIEPRRAKIAVFGKMERRPVGLVIDEWGVWHDDAPIADGFRQNGTLRDALFAAAGLNLFHRYASRISMTNIAQAIDCLHSLLLTAGSKLELTPTFYVYEMFREHQGARSLRVDTSRAPEISNGPQSRSALSGSASQSGDSLLITLVNLSAAAGVDVRVTVRGSRLSAAGASLLTGDSVRSEKVTVRPGKIAVDRDTITTNLPAHSVQAIRTKVAL